MSDRPPIYPHRRTKDGSYISICLRCLERVARCKAEADLAKHDKSHICDSTFLAERGHFGGAESVRRSDPVPPARPEPAPAQQRVVLVAQIMTFGPNEVC